MYKKFSLILTVILINGCTHIGEGVEATRDDDFVIGCVTNCVNANANAYNQQGTMELCKFKCSKDLPDTYCFEINDQRTGVKAKAGKGCDKD